MDFRSNFGVGINYRETPYKYKDIDNTQFWCLFLWTELCSGQAYVNGKVAIICLPGIKEEFCGKRENN